MSKSSSAARPDGSIDVDTLDIKKAGFVVYGRTKDKLVDAEGNIIILDKKRLERIKSGKEKLPTGTNLEVGQLCVLATYTQGRFNSDINDRRKYYGLPKGSVDDEEDPITGGKREAREETGISIKKLIGEENMRRLRSGEDGKLFKSNHYGVSVVKAYARPSDFAYVSASGAPRRMNMFFVEVDNIEALDTHKDMKRPPLAENECQLREPFTWEQPHLEYSVADYPRKHSYPTLQELLGILRTGAIEPTKQDPKSLPWVPAINHTVIEHPIFKELEKEWCARQHPKQSVISTQEDWLRFCKETEQNHPNEYKKLEKHFLKIKAYFNGTGICGDRTFIKLDEKDMPLNFFFEGGEVIPLTHFLTRTAALAEDNAIYRDSMWGEYAGDKLPLRTPAHKSHAAQVAGVLPRDGQQLLDSDIYSINEAINILTGIEKGMSWAGKQAIAERIAGIKGVLESDKARTVV